MGSYIQNSMGMLPQNTDHLVEEPHRLRRQRSAVVVEEDDLLVNIILFQDDVVQQLALGHTFGVKRESAQQIAGPGGFNPVFLIRLNKKPVFATLIYSH